MDPDVVKLAQVLIVVTTFGIVGSTAYLILRAIFVRIGRRAPAVPPLAAVDDTRFARLEQAVDAIALEVERISEAQRFAARLMAERAGGATDGAARIPAPPDDARRG